jgi:outer membrane protein assembly factor BamD (BamD/ComL family)
MSRRAIFLGLLFCVLQSFADYEQERQFIEGLTDAGFPKLAEKVLFRTLEKYPEAQTAAPALRIRILIADKKFEEAAQQIQNLQNPPRPPGTPPQEGSGGWSTATDGEGLWLFLAGNAYNSNQKPAAEAAYKNYFKIADDPDDQAAFNYGSLLEERGDDAAAIKLYEQVDSRPAKSRLAALLVESDPDRALKLAEEVQLGGLDLWFGSAVVTWAQVMIGKEEWGEAQSVLETQLELLKPISDAVPPAVAPLAGARYFLGLCYEHENKKAEALTQFYNVYAKYGDSEWGPKAQEKAQALKDWFEGQGKTVKIDLGANRAKMEQSAFSTGRRLFFDRQYAGAIPATIAALNEYPEGSESITALRELCVSAIQLDDRLTARTVGLYLAERFTADPNAGDALLAAGKAALDAENEVLAWTLYDLYIEEFPTHPRAPAVLYSLSGLRKNESYLFQLLEKYPESSYYARALGRLAWNAFEAEDYQTAAERFAPYVDTEADPQKQTRARFAFAECFRNLKKWGEGSAFFQTLENAMEKAAKGFGVSKETLEFNQPYWEKSIYYQAVCHKEFGQIDEAIADCDRFLEQFPTSGISEQVRFTKAQALFDATRFAEALVALDDLDGKFAEPVTYYRGVALYETGAYEQSFQTLEKLLTDWPVSAFTYEAMFVQGRAYNAAGRQDDAIRVFGDIMSFASDDELLNRASLELGRAQTDPAEKLASFQRVALLADPEKYPDLIAAALFESLPLYLELNRPADLIADADRLTAEFPNIGNVEQIALLKTKAEATLEQQKEETTNLH